MSERVVDPYPDFHNFTNVSIDQYSEFALSLTIWKYGSPTLLLVGTMGNMLSILVLSRKRLRQLTTMFYLTVLAIADLAVLYTGLLRLWLDNVFEEYIRLQSDFACKFHTFIVYLALDFSVWILVAVTVDRCICVSAPFAARRWCTLRNARFVVFIILVVDFLVNMHYLWTVDIIYHGMRTIAGDDHFTCYTSQDPGEAFFLEKVWPWLDFGVVCLVPFVIMLTCNCLIIRQIILSARNLRAHHKPKKPAAVPEDLPETSKKSFFSRSKSFVRRFRNRQVEAADARPKKGADKNESAKDCGENSSVSAVPSSGNRTSSEKNQANRAVQQNRAACPETCPSKQLPDHSSVQSLINRCETGEGERCERTLPVSALTSSSPRNLFLRAGQDECSLPACADSSSGLEKDASGRQTHLSTPYGSEAEALHKDAGDQQAQSFGNAASSISLIQRSQRGERRRRETSGGSFCYSFNTQEWNISSTLIQEEIQSVNCWPTMRNYSATRDTRKQLLMNRPRCGSMLLLRLPPNSESLRMLSEVNECTFAGVEENPRVENIARQGADEIKQTQGQEIKTDQLLQLPPSSPARTLPQDKTELSVSAPMSASVIPGTAQGSGEGTGTPRLLQVHPPCQSQLPAKNTTRKRLAVAHSVTVMLLAVNTLFWLLTAPIVVFVIGYAYWQPGSSQQENARLALGWAVVNMLQYTNNTVHFFLYCLTGPRFREELVAMFRHVGSVRTLSTVN